MIADPKPRITIATVVYNAAPIVETAIRSIARQTYGNLEYLIIDGASTDGTVSVLERNSDTIDRWISEPDAGIYDAMNKALRLATGDWLLFLGADDELLVPLESIVGRFSDSAAVYYGDVEVTSSARRTGGPSSRYTLMQRNICHQAIFYPRAVYQRKPYDTKVGLLADYLYNIELWGEQVPFVHVDSVVSRFNDAGLSAGAQPYFDDLKLAAIRRNFGRGYYLLKRARDSAVRWMRRPLIMPRRAP